MTRAETGIYLDLNILIDQENPDAIGIRDLVRKSAKLKSEAEAATKERHSIDAEIMTYIEKYSVEGFVLDSWVVDLIKVSGRTTWDHKKLARMMTPQQIDEVTGIGKPSQHMRIKADVELAAKIREED